jgi:AcrR family transcriptional regulator
VSPRGTDTRQRILDTALELFSAQGYERTSLREIADRLDIRKASLYYHFASKEAVLQGLMGRLAAPVDELLAWAEAQERTPAMRTEFLRRLAELLSGDWSNWLRFVQANQAAIRELPDANGQAQGMQERMIRLIRCAVDPAADLHDQLKSVLAVLAIYIGNLAPVMPILGVDVPQEELRAALFDVALDLAGGTATT